jgi:phosphopantothenoylcysteine decarboxylase/phosphopantothenate--cysteine ligase
MGIALATEAAAIGAEVKLIYGSVNVPLPQNQKITLIHASSSEDMLDAVKKEFKDSNALIMAAAVADWRMQHVADHKLKKHANQQTLTLTLVKTADILHEVASHKQQGQVVVGFAAETNDLLQNAEKKLVSKGADMIVANDVSKNVFGDDEDQVTILQKNNPAERWPKMSKHQVAQKLLQQIAQMI